MEKFCRACGDENMEVILDLGEQPLANGLLNKEEIGKEKKYPLALCFCKSCGTAQLNYVVDPEQLFSNYYWVTGTSEGAKEYAKIFKKNALCAKNINEGGYVFEVASNDGTFLKAFKEEGFEVLGVDPARNIALSACENGITTIIDFFGSRVAKDIIEKKGYPDIYYARNVMPHVADVDDFAEGLSICGNEENIGIVEVHYAGNIVKEVHYDSIYHEHIFYFTLHSLKNILEKHGLHIFDVKNSPISGGSIVVYFSKGKRVVSDAVTNMLKKEKEEGLDKIDSWLEFAKKAKEHKELLRKLVESSEGPIIGYGASARSSTMLNYCGIDCKEVECIIDLNPLKQGLYTAGTYIPIVSAEQALGGENKPDVILILAWNFKNEIVRFLRDKYKYDGNIIIPLPYPGRKENINNEKCD